MLKFYEENENQPSFCWKIPTDEGQYCNKWQVEYMLERKKENNLEVLEQLYKEHKNLYRSYDSQVTRPNEAKFHLERTWDILEKMIANKDIQKIFRSNEVNFHLNRTWEIVEKNIENKDIQKIFKRTIFCWDAFGNWHRVMGNLELSKQYLTQSLRNIHGWKLKSEKNNCGKTDEEENKKIEELEANLSNSLGLLYQNLDSLQKAEGFYLKSLKIRHIFGENLAVESSMTNLGGLYVIMGDLRR